jgi:regulation of enolase protein 1 (concanavalin A-like superfamily)
MHFRETFSSPSLSPPLQWRNPPPEHTLTAQGLKVVTAAHTDFWQRTHYGFQVDNGHHLCLPLSGDFTLSTKVISTPKNRYDQAGLLVWLSPECWLKTAVEFEPDQPSRLGAVVTNLGWSDWSTQDLVSDYGAAWFRIVRTRSDYTVYAATGDPERDLPKTWAQIRIAHLHEAAGPIYAGLYACSPQEAGLEATFAWLEVEGA